MEPNLYKQLYSISKIKIGSRSFNKWEDYTAEIKPEYYAKLKEFVVINNNGEGKKSRAFRLKKNGQDTGVFHRNNGPNLQQDEYNLIENNSQINIDEQNDNEINEI